MNLHDYPTAVLIAELRRRNREPCVDPADASVIVGDLEVDPLGCVVTWRGHALRVTAGQCELLYALALARWQGVRWLRTDRLAVRLYHVADPAALSCVRQQVHYLRQQLPGVILSGPRAGHGRLGSYGLNVNAHENAA